MHKCPCVRWCGCSHFLKVRSCNLNPCPFLSEAPLLCHTPLFGQSARTVQSAVLRLRTDLPTKSCAFWVYMYLFVTGPSHWQTFFQHLHTQTHTHTHTHTHISASYVKNCHGEIVMDQLAGRSIRNNKSNHHGPAKRETEEACFTSISIFTTFFFHMGLTHLISHAKFQIQSRKWPSVTLPRISGYG